MANVRGCERAWALITYDAASAELVAALKRRHHRDALDQLTEAMAALVTGQVAVVTWAPTTPGRRRQRGYDQAELLARGVARALGRPAAALLRRSSSRTQTGLGRRERLEGPSFTPRPAATHAAGRVLVVDDVRTTGATLAAAAAALSRGGCDPPCALTLAVRP